MSRRLVKSNDLLLAAYRSCHKSFIFELFLSQQQTWENSTKQVLVHDQIKLQFVLMASAMSAPRQPKYALFCRRDEMEKINDLIKHGIPSV